MITKNPMVNWTYSKSHQGFHNLIDPRTAIARQLNWQRSTSNITEYTLPEPENYNRAVYSPCPIEFTWVKFQVIYKDTYRNAWITACHLTAAECLKFDAWAQANDMTYWRHHKPRSLRHRKLLLERGATKAEISLDERLLTMGYYKNMVVKYFDGDAHIVKSRLGEARACLADLFNDE
jgi:hypothetical protein